MTSTKPRPARTRRKSGDLAEDAGGRERLIAAALKLAAEKRSLHGLGVRELGRTAGLNPNTFYRHFRNIEELSLAIIDEHDLALELRRIRLASRSPEQMSRDTVEFVFDYARQHPEAFIIGVRELHGASDELRRELRARLQRAASEMAQDILLLNAVPGMTAEMIDELASPIVEQVFHRTLDYLETPRERAALVARTARFIDALLLGAVTLKTLNRWGN